MFSHHIFALHCALIVLACIIVYANTLTAPLVLDDIDYIVKNPTLRDWDVFARAQNSDLTGLGKNFLIPFRSRVVAFFTFALGYRIHGLSPFGYHIANLLIHISSALTLYWLMTMLLRTPRGQIIDDEGFTDRWTPLLAGLLFAVHPLQTQAITYVSQRFTSLSTLFYLLALALYVRSRIETVQKRGLMLYVLSSVAVLLAARTKEIAFTLPAAMLLIEACFFEGWRGIRLWRLAPWALIVMVIPVSLLYQQGGTDITGAVNTANLKAISGWDYLLTEQRVMVTYLRLLIVPINQNIDYDYPVYHSIFQGAVFGSMLVHAGLLWLALQLYRSSRRDGLGFLVWGSFGIAWFYLTLSVESSVIPLGDVIEEYRMYLPLAGVSMAVAAIGAHWAHRSPRAVIAVAVCALIAFGAASAARNHVWRNPVALWEDAARKSPNKARPYNNLGYAYETAGNIDMALEAYSRAVDLDPNYALANMNIANLLAGREQYDRALGYYEAALALNPGDDAILNSFGFYYMRTGDLKQAESYLERALEVNPFNAGTYNHMGSLYREQGQCDKAMGFLAESLRLDPEMAETHYILGLCHTDNGRQEEAIREFLAAISLNGKLVEAHVNLGMSYLRTGQSLLAVERFKVALELERSAEVMTDLADAYQIMGENGKAQDYYIMAIRKEPGFAPARFNYILLLARQGRRDDAITQIDGLREISPERVERLMSDPLMREFLADKRRP